VIWNRKYDFKSGTFKLSFSKKKVKTWRAGFTGVCVVDLEGKTTEITARR